MPSALPSSGLARPRAIQLPRTSDRLQYRWGAHLKVVTGVVSRGFLTMYEGKLYKPGVVVPAEELGDTPIVLECVGPVGEPRPKPGGARKYRDVRWVLWRYDWEEERWEEIASAQSIDASWTEMLRQPVINALRGPGLVDVKHRGREVASKLMVAIQDALEMEPEPVRAVALTSLYDQVAGRIAQLCA
jgi:hypothetical protein